MARHTQYAPIYSAFQGFMTRCLLDDRSLLWPDQEVWTITNLEQLRRRFVEGFIQGRMSFRQKLEAQLGGAPPEVWALAADSFYVYGLPSRTIRWQTKKGLVEWAAERAGLALLPEDDPLWEPLRQGFAPTGQKYNLKHAQLRLLTLLALEVKAAPDRQWLLASPPALQALLDGLLDSIPLRIDRANDMRNAILYMAFPDEYEPLLANRDKDAVLRHYGPRLIGMPTGSLPAERDVALRKVREALQLRFPNAPQPFDFYDDLRDEWKPAPSLERAMAQQIREEQARYAVRTTRGGSHAWQTAGEEGQTQPTTQRYSALAQPGGSAEPAPDDAPTRPVQVAREPSAAGKPPAGAQPESGRPVGGRLEGWRFSRADEDDPDARRVLAALRLTRNVILAGPPGTGKTYLAERVARRLVEAPETGGQPAAKNDKGSTAYGGPASGGSDPERFIWWLTLHPSYAYEDFVEGLRPVISEDRVEGDNPLSEEILRQEEQKAAGKGGRDKNSGGRAPGRAGKGQPGGAETGGIAYQVRPGAFRQVCELAAQDPAHPYVLVLDEINRANLSRILGELITLIEDDKRGVLSARLPYSGRSFTVPPNLILLGTMNTADRSVALLDSALRRRFAFVDVMPRPDLLVNTVVETEEAVLHLDDLLRCLNAAIREHLGRDHELGHSYFLRVVNAPLEERLGALELVWNNQVLPLLEEYFYARREQLADLLSPFLEDGTHEPYSQVDPVAAARLTGEDLVVALSRMCLG